MTNNNDKMIDNLKYMQVLLALSGHIDDEFSETINTSISALEKDKKKRIRLPEFCKRLFAI